jgi:predicted RNA binding protein YcfA (HicA-like mRNA interferase family)
MVMIIKISRSQWEFIGEITGWLKTAGTPPVRLPIRELTKRLQEIGWKTDERGAHVMLFEPSGKCGPVTIGKHNYETGHHLWKSVMGEILRCNKDLKFVFMSPFQIPENFNIQTQQIEVPQQQSETTSIQMPFVSIPFDKYQVQYNNKWVRIVDVDYRDLTLMTEDGEIIKVTSPLQQFVIRPIK